MAELKESGIFQACGSLFKSVYRLSFADGCFVVETLEEGRFRSVSYHTKEDAAHLALEALVSEPGVIAYCAEHEVILDYSNAQPCGLCRKTAPAKYSSGVIVCLALTSACLLRVQFGWRVTICCFLCLVFCLALLLLRKVA